MGAEMTVDWVAIVEGQRDLARVVAHTVTSDLSRPNLTVRQTNQLADQIAVGSLALKTILRSLYRHVTDEAFYLAADSLRKLWTDLEYAVDQRKRELASRRRGRRRH